MRLKSFAWRCSGGKTPSIENWNVPPLGAWVTSICFMVIHTNNSWVQVEIVALEVTMAIRHRSGSHWKENVSSSGDHEYPQLISISYSHSFNVLFKGRNQLTVALDHSAGESLEWLGFILWRPWMVLPVMYLLCSVLDWPMYKLDISLWVLVLLVYIWTKV